MKVVPFLAVIGLALGASSHEVIRTRRSTEDVASVDDDSTSTTTDAGLETTLQTSETSTCNCDREATTSAEETNAGSNSTEAGNTCETITVCHDNDDCNGGTCFGVLIGTCNCNNCLSFSRCSSDDDCGGFHHACNTTTELCECFEAFVLNGFEDPSDGLSKTCNIKTCSKATARDDCYGMPCHTGQCLC